MPVLSIVALAMDAVAIVMWAVRDGLPGVPSRTTLMVFLVGFVLGTVSGLPTAIDGIRQGLVDPAMQGGHVSILGVLWVLGLIVAVLAIGSLCWAIWIRSEDDPTI